RALLEALKDPEPGVVRFAVFQLGQMRDKRSVAALRGVAVGDNAAGVRAEALRALANLGDEWIVPHCKQLDNCDDDEVRSLARVALADLGSPEALAILERIFQSEADHEGRLELALLLGRYGVHAVEQFLCEQVARPGSDGVLLMIAAC